MKGEVKERNNFTKGHNGLNYITPIDFININKN